MRVALILFVLLSTVTTAEAQVMKLDVGSAERFANLALACVHREYPNKIAHVMNSDADVQPPRKLTPAFYGCFDWHSSVHGHWLLVRLTKQFPDAPFASKARAELAKSFTAENLATEAKYVEVGGRESFERPYGLAWLLQLSRELHTWNDPEAKRWAANLAPLENAVVNRLKVWLPKLSYPVRSGEHSQTAFGLGLALDWARMKRDDGLASMIESRARSFYLHDRACPLSYEPSGEDFLSPCLAEADLMRRVMRPTEFGAWLGAFLPQIPINSGERFLEPAVVTDPSDGKLAHLDGLNLSRAWMLDGIASVLPADDPRKKSLEATRDAHAASGLASVTGEHYEGGHWLGSFATYLTTRAGVEKQ